MSAHLKSYRKWKAQVHGQQQYLRDNARGEPEVGLHYSREKYVDGELIARLFILLRNVFFDSGSGSLNHARPQRRRPSHFGLFCHS